MRHRLTPEFAGGLRQATAVGVIWELAGRGIIRRGQPSLAKADTLFQPASTTKVKTAPVVMHLVERGQTDLDSSVLRYLPNLVCRMLLFKLPARSGTLLQSLWRGTMSDRLQPGLA